MNRNNQNIRALAAAALLALMAPLFAAAQSEDSLLSRSELNLAQNAAAAAEFTAATANLGQSIAASGIPGALPVFDAGLHAQNVIEAEMELDHAAAKVTEVQLSIGEEILKALEKVLYENLKKKILDMVVDQIIGYIQGEGSPRFITDWEGFFGDIVQGTTGDLVKELGLGFLCSPFSLPVRLKIAASLVPVERFKTKFDCTLDQIVGNVNNFFEDFRNGGWKAYALSWEPQNNYYGAVWLAWDEQQNRLARKLFAAANEAIANDGWLGVKKCYDPATGEEISSDLGVHASANANCIIVTPGKALGDLASEALATDLHWLVNAEDLSSYIASITNALINRVIKEGVGLLGVSTPSAPQRVGTRDTLGNLIFDAGNIPAGARQANSQYQNTIGSANVQETIFGQSASSTKNLIKKQLEGLRDARGAADISMNQRLSIENNYLTVLRALRTCQEANFGLAAGATTTTQINNQLTVINNLQSDILENRGVLAQYDFAIRELTGLTEAQVVANLSHYQNLLAGLTEALNLKQRAAEELALAGATITSLTAAANDKLNQCKQGHQ